MTDQEIERTEAGTIKINGVEYTPDAALEFVDEILAEVRRDT